MHRLLARQITRNLGSPDAADQERLSGLLRDVDASYQQADQDRKLLERALDLTSQELLERDDALRVALQAAKVGTWSYSPETQRLSCQGDPHPCFPSKSGRFAATLRELADSIDVRDRSTFERAFGAMVAGRRELAVRFRLLDGDVVRTVEMRGGAAVHPRGTRYSGVSVDVTDETERVARRERLHAALAELTRTLATGRYDLSDTLSLVTRLVTAALDLEFAGIWLYDANTYNIRCIEAFDRVTGEHSAGAVIDLSEYPAYRSGIEEGRILAADDARSDPKTCELAEVYFVPNDVCSTLDAPVHAAGRRLGVICLEKRRSKRKWTEDEKSFAASVADLVAVMLEGAQRVEAEAALDQQRAFLREIIDANPNYIFVRDRSGRFTLVNQAVADLYATEPRMMIGRGGADINAHQDDVLRFRSVDLEVIDRGVERVFEEIVTDFAGRQHWLHMVKRRIRHPRTGDEQILAVAADVTALKEAAEKQAILAQELREAQKLEALGLLAGGIAHDFNNLLTPIICCAESIAAEAEPDSPQAVDARDIGYAAKRACELTRQLLAFGRRQLLSVRSIDVNEELESAARMLRRIIPENVEVLLDIRARVPFALADAAQIQQVIMNLAINAQYAMPHGGSLILRTRSIEVGAQAWLEIVVEDSGVGMTPEVQAQIFEPFFTTRELGRGTGLGLSSVYGIVQQHRGSISVDSEVGRGTTFTVRLPVGSGPSPSHGSQRSRLPSRPRFRGRILVVEDDVTVLELVRRLLSADGYEIATAANPQHALARARVDGVFDLLLTDIVMPTMNGRELHERLAEIQPTMRVLYMSGYAGDVLDSHLDAPNSIRLLHKPFTPAELRAQVAAALDDPIDACIGSATASACST